jgi:hypothetical protein
MLWGVKGLPYCWVWEGVEFSARVGLYRGRKIGRLVITINNYVEDVLEIKLLFWVRCIDCLRSQERMLSYIVCLEM